MHIAVFSCGLKTADSPIYLRVTSSQLTRRESKNNNKKQNKKQPCSYCMARTVLCAYYICNKRRKKYCDCYIMDGGCECYHFGNYQYLHWLIVPQTTVDGLTHWGWTTHIYVGNLTTISSDNGLSPGRHQAIICTIAGIVLIGTNFIEILIEIHTFSYKKMHLKTSSKGG